MFKKVIILGVILMFPLIGYAQVVPPSAPVPPPPGLPIDGISGMLFLVALIYGSKKILKDSSS